MQNIKYALKRYVEDRIPTGGFLRAVLENDLLNAITRADDENVKRIREIVQYIYWELPSNCWGTPQRVFAWLERKE